MRRNAPALQEAQIASSTHGGMKKGLEHDCGFPEMDDSHQPPRVMDKATD
jgi:hypothetical protein